MKAIQKTKKLSEVKKLSKLRSLFLISLISLVYLTTAQAQVRIGEDAAPTKGTVLDLASSSGGYIGGLKLPCVAITDLLEIPAGMEGFSETMSTLEKNDLAGMIVYNTNRDVPGGAGIGVYYWTGAMWIKENGKAAAIEPWYKVGTTEPSTGNTDDSYLMANVGIGESAPAERLHVDGNTYITGHEWIGNRIGVKVPQGTDPEAAIRIFSDNKTDLDDDIAIESYRGESSGFAKTPTLSLMSARGTHQDPQDAEAGDIIGSMVFWPRINGQFESFKARIQANYIGGEKAKITVISHQFVSEGDVGIGTPNPTNKLHIDNGTTNGAIKITDGTQGEGKVLTSNSAGVGTWQNIAWKNIGLVDEVVANNGLTRSTSNTKPIQLGGPLTANTEILLRGVNGNLTFTSTGSVGGVGIGLKPDAIPDSRLHLRGDLLMEPSDNNGISEFRLIGKKIHPTENPPGGRLGVIMFGKGNNMNDMHPNYGGAWSDDIVPDPYAFIEAIDATPTVAHTDRTTNVSGKLRFGTRNNAVASVRMTIDELGNVGVGTTAPKTKFHINTGGTAADPIKGFMLQDGNEKNAGWVLTTDADGLATWKDPKSSDVLGDFYVPTPWYKAGSDPAEASTENTDDSYLMAKIGIGTNEPLEQLHVNGSTYTTENAWVDGRIGVNVPRGTTPSAAIHILSDNNDDNKESDIEIETIRPGNDDADYYNTRQVSTLAFLSSRGNFENRKEPRIGDIVGEIAYKPWDKNNNGGYLNRPYSRIDAVYDGYDIEKEEAKTSIRIAATSEINLIAEKINVNGKDIEATIQSLQNLVAAQQQIIDELKARLEVLEGGAQ